MEPEDVYRVKTGRITSYFTAVLPSLPLEKIVEDCKSLGWEATIAQLDNARSVIFFSAEKLLVGSHSSTPSLLLGKGYSILSVYTINPKSTSACLLDLAQKSRMIIVSQSNDDIKENKKFILSLNREGCRVSEDYGLRNSCPFEQAWKILNYASFLRYARDMDNQDAIIAARRRFARL